MADEPELADILFHGPESPPRREPKIRRHQLNQGVVVFAAAAIAGIAGRLIVQHVDRHTFQAPVWLVVVCAIGMAAVAQRYWRPTVEKTALALCIVATAPLVDLALPVPVGLMLVLAVLGTRTGH